VEEMKRGVRGEERDVELQDGCNFQGVDEGMAGPSVMVAMGAGLQSAKPRPSFNSKRTGVSGAPEKVAREFV